MACLVELVSLLIGLAFFFQVVQTFDQQCHFLSGRLTGGSAAFKTIAHLNQHLFFITKDDYIYELPASWNTPNQTQLQVNETIYPMKLTGKWPALSTEPLVELISPNSTSIAMQMTTLGNGSVLFGTQQNATLQFSVSCNVISERCQAVKYQLPNVTTSALINSAEPEVLYTLDENQTLTKYVLNGSTFHPIYEWSRYLALLGNSTDHLLVSSSVCPTCDALQLDKPFRGFFTGFMTQQNVYLFGQQTLYIFPSSALTRKADDPFVVKVATIPLSEFITCNESSPNVIVVVSSSGPSFYLWISSFFVLLGLFVFLAIWAVVKKRKPKFVYFPKIEYLVKREYLLTNV